MSKQEAGISSAEGLRISRRQFLKKFAIGGAILSGLGTLFFAEKWNRDATQKAVEVERNETGGYAIRDIGPNLKQITLLKSGEYSQVGTLFTWSEGDIRGQTLGNALSELSEGCEIESVTAITEKSGCGSTTSGLIVQVKSCK